MHNFTDITKYMKHFCKFITETIDSSFSFCYACENPWKNGLRIPSKSLVHLFDLALMFIILAMGGVSDDLPLSHSFIHPTH